MFSGENARYDSARTTLCENGSFEMEIEIANTSNMNTTGTMDTELASKKPGVPAIIQLIECIGYSISSVCLTIAITIFLTFQELRRTKSIIDVNLFVATFGLSVIRLIQTMDALISSNGVVKNTAYLCEALHILDAFAASAMIAWTLVEGIFLLTMISKDAIGKKFPLRKYTAVAWGAPLIITAASVNYVLYYYYTGQINDTCLFAYTIEDIFWIIELPRLIVMTINFGILIKVVMTVVSKEKNKNIPNLKALVKGLKTAFFLLPILGTLNWLTLFEPWTNSQELISTTHIIDSFHGTILSILLCILTQEVRQSFQNQCKFVTTRQPEASGEASTESYSSMTYVLGDPRGQSRNRRRRHQEHQETAV